MPLFKKRRGPSDISSASKLVTGSKIGVGSFGEVFSVCLKKDKKKTTYACKELDSRKINRQGILSQIRAEKDTMIQIRGHSSIVHLFSYWESPEKVFFLMEYCDAGDMFDRVRNSKKLSSAVCGRYLLQISSALDFVHESCIIYRDLKLENILLKKVGDVALLADFGLSKVMTARDGRTKTICGTIQYMAPELLNDEPYGQAIDWWSLGVMTYVMLTGRYPFSTGVDSLKYDCSASDRVIMYKRISAAMLVFPDFLKEDAVTIEGVKLLLTANLKERATSCARLKETAWLRDIHEVAPATTGSSLSKPNLILPGEAGGAQLTKKRSRILRLKNSLLGRRSDGRAMSQGSGRGSLRNDGIASPKSSGSRRDSTVNPPALASLSSRVTPGSATDTAAQLTPAREAAPSASDGTAATRAAFSPPAVSTASASGLSGNARQGKRPALPAEVAAAADQRPMPPKIEITEDPPQGLADLSVRHVSVVDFDEDMATAELQSIIGAPENMVEPALMSDDESLPPTPTADDALKLEAGAASPAKGSAWATFGAAPAAEDQLVEAPVQMAPQRSLEDLRNSQTAVDAIHPTAIFERRATHASIFEMAAGSQTPENPGERGRMRIPKTLPHGGSAPDLTLQLQKDLLTMIEQSSVDESAV